MRQLNVQWWHIPQETRFLIVPMKAIFTKLHVEVHDESAQHGTDLQVRGPNWKTMSTTEP